ncbi:hypothetical protein SKTS_19410 [Sulfurimicrobium lacus]|uniref:Phage protein n=1 Tax=Sulfurimicrobium lacus TaxID=2715678 RepID=A0A6F8VE70_9PROT|nr:hypothetical protein [Sulfurimicrobium lacus]BCB27055.1 hypothetical protein SKTS_19410 [Sulfurimicrobium lacus]
MASEVDICNLSLANLGDNATVTSLNPPEGAAQAEHCARFYPVARDSLLEMHSWSFATKREQLAQLGTGGTEWDYSYAQPSDALSIIAVLPPDATDDYSIGLPNVPTAASASYVPQAFSCEVDGSGNDVILTDQATAVLRYTSVVTDTTKFSPLFTVTLAWHLSSMLAGPMLKGDAGAAESKRCAAMMRAYLSLAIESDTKQRRIAPQHNVGWINRR